MTCVIRVISGPDKGLASTVDGTELLLGRSPKSRIQFSSAAISWEHAVVCSNETGLTIENLSASGTWVNEQRITVRVPLQAKDKIKLAPDVILQVELAERKKTWIPMALLVASIIAIGLGVVFFTAPDELPPQPAQWPLVYGELDQWLKRKVLDGQCPRQVATLFEDSWRFQRSTNYRSAAKTWGALNLAASSLTLSQDSHAQLWTQLAFARGHALDALLIGNPSPNLSDEDAAAAIVQFARISYRWNLAKVQSEEGS
jgi:hypothetical protein